MRAYRRAIAAAVAGAMCLATMPTIAAGMPASKPLQQRARKDAQLQKRLQSLEKRQKSLGVDRGLVGGPKKVSGKFRALVILVDFKDKRARTKASKFNKLVFASSGRSLTKFYKDASYGSFDVVTANLPSKLGWKRMRKRYSTYVGGQNGFGNYPNNAQGLTEAAVKAVDSKVNFRKYDNDKDGYVDAIFVVHAGTGAELSGSSNDIWSHQWVVVNGKTKDKVKIREYSMEPEFWYKPGDMTVGVYAHEFGHVLGLTDYYDTSYQSSGVGAWSLMAGGSWNGNLGSVPSRLDACCANELGFVDPVVVSGDGAYNIPSVDQSRNDTVYLLRPQGAASSEYFLVENRELRGWDAGLPGAGLLVWHCDEAVADNTNSSHYRLDLEEAHGWFQDLELGWNEGDALDPFGSGTNRVFDDSTDPSANTYSGGASGVSVSDVSDPGSTMSARLRVP